MKTSSAKAKGRRACAELREVLLQVGARLGLKDDDIKVVPSGVTGEDLWLSPAARKVFPYAIEVKNQESIQIWKACLQAEAHAKGTDYIPLLAFRRNKERFKVCLDLEWFLKITEASRYPLSGGRDSKAIAEEK